MTRLIVPLDGSPEAEGALPHARVLAGHDPVMLLTSVWHGEPLAPRRYYDERALALIGEPVETRILVDEPPAQAILDAAAEDPTALVCMASHGRNAIGQAVLGSTAEAVVRRSTGPVMLVGPHASYDATRAEARNLVVAVDNADTAESIMPVAMRFADRHHLHLWTVQTVAPAPYPFVTNAPDPDAVEAGGLHRAVAVAGRHERSVETKVLSAADPADAIVHFATELPAAFVVMGSHGRSGLARLALGSVAMRVVHRAACPVMIVRA